MKDKKSIKDDQSATKGKFRLRNLFGGSKRPKSALIVSSGLEATNGERSKDVNDFQLEVIGKAAATSPIRQNRQQKVTGSNLIPLVPMNDAFMTIDNAPIGRAAEAASIAGSRASSKQRAAGMNRAKVATKNNKNRSWLSWICRTRYFSNLCDSVFDSIDNDKSHAVDKNELYQGLLLIHLKLGTYAGPAACKPLSRERCNEVFVKMDIDRSGYLDKNEFREVMIILFGNVFLRVIVQWYLTIIFVPIAAKFILSQSIIWYEIVTQYIIHLDQYNTIINSIELAISDEIVINTKTNYVDPIIDKIPDIVMVSCNRVYNTIQSIPDSVWSSIPLTLVSSILGLVVVPYVIFKIDDFFTWLGDLRGSHTTTKKVTTK